MLNGSVEVIDDPARIRSLLAGLHAQGRRAFVRSLATGPTRARAARLSPTGGLLVDWQVGTEVPEPPLEVEISGYYSDFLFVIHDVGRSAPDRLLRLRRRSRRRVGSPPGAVVTVPHPRYPAATIRRRLLDVSIDGFSFETDPQEDQLAPGMALDGIVLTWKRGTDIELEGIVRHVTPRIHGQGFACGVSLTGLVDQRWHQEVERLIFPHTDNFTAPLGGLWDLFAASGYLGLSDKQAAEFAPLRPAFESACKKLAAAPDLGCQVSWSTQERVEASISLLKVWEHGWLVFQLARQQEARPLWLSSNEILRDVYLHAYEHAARDPALHWHVAYVQDSAGWSRQPHLDFVRQYADGERAAVVPMRVWEAHTERGAAVPGIDVATPTESAELLGRVSRTRPPAYVEALDLVPARFAQGDLRARWKVAGLLRERGVLVARDAAGAPMAAALLELGEDGLHLFGLLDIVRLFPLQPGGEARFLDLLRGSLAWYAQRGKRKVAFFDENGVPEVARALCMTDLGGASCTVMSAALTPDMLERVVEITAPAPGEEP